MKLNKYIEILKKYQKQDNLKIKVQSRCGAKPPISRSRFP